jgi:hypothetical protein
MLRMLTWDWVGPQVESRGSLLGKGGECGMESQHLQGCSPRLRQLRVEGLVSMSKYWTYWSHARDMSPINQCSLLPIDTWLFPIASMVVCGAETRYGPTDRSAGVLWIGIGALFLRSSRSVQLCWQLTKGCHIRGLSAGSIQVAYVD